MSKEILKANVVDAKTLFVGVGGIGSKIVCRVAEMCRPGEAKNVNFVCMDTNANDLRDVKNSEAQIYYVQTSSTQTVGNYLNHDSDALNNWFPKSRVMYDKTVSEGAGQVRAISRLALNATIKNGNINRLWDAVDDLFRKDGSDLKQALRVVLVSSASGGTGSGMILPLSMLLRDYVNSKYPNTGTIIRTTLLLPETLDSVITSNAEKESQRRNAYATVKEINAFMMKGTGIFDTAEELARFKDLHIDFPVPGSDELRQLSLLPCDFCFLLDGQNAEDDTLISLEQYRRQAAQALYEQNIGPMQRQAFSVEDNVIKEFTAAGNFARNRFGGIGASVLRYPYEDVADFVACGWAMDSIGGSGEAAKWCRYDNAYAVQLREARKRGIPQSSPEFPQRGSSYVQAVRTGEDAFSKDLYAKYFLDEADLRVADYADALTSWAVGTLENNIGITSTRANANALSSPIDYKAMPNHQHKATANLAKLRDYELAIVQSAAPTARMAAESLFYNDNKIAISNEPYMLESILKTATHEMLHPNAMRFMLYLAEQEFSTRLENAKNERDKANKILKRYAPNADMDGLDAQITKKKEERSLDDFCGAENNSDLNVFAQKRGYTDYYDKLNECFVSYHKNITNLSRALVAIEAFSVGLAYIQQLSRAFEAFYQSFAGKVDGLVRRREQIASALAFHKGDSVLNVCATPALLLELEKTTAHIQAEETMLESDLCGEIFDSIKKNVAFEREVQYLDVVEDDRRIDVFDSVLLGYFGRAVRRSADSIDLNILQAIALEDRLLARIQAREEQGDSGRQNDKIFDARDTDDSGEQHIAEVLARAQRLAAPGIQRVGFRESREIHLCAYNTELNEMRAYPIDRLLRQLPDRTDHHSGSTVSRYELHFFNALYNLTPDKLNKFACPEATETRARDAGLYHKAYVSYSRNIGPDSTKGLTLTTHIDKRWDSLAVLPELDLGFQARQMMRIHQAMIYALIHGAIVYRTPSQVQGCRGRFYYEDSQERLIELVVPNGTSCDEFYEILNSFYISFSIVEDVTRIREHRRARDLVRHANFVDTAFARDLAAFRLDTQHDGPTSLFEIPLLYWNSLPNSVRYRDEIVALVAAVIQTLSDELFDWEKPEDASILLRNMLLQQYELLVANYKKFDELSHGTSLRDNAVVDIVYRKVRAVFDQDPELTNAVEIVDHMRSLIR